MKKQVLFVGLVLLIKIVVLGQSNIGRDSIMVKDSILKQTSPISIWGYADVYYAYSFNRPPNRIVGEMVNGTSAVYSHDRHNMFNINNGIIGVKYAKDKVRGEFALQAGTFVISNYASEPEALRNIFQAYAGYQVRKKIWVDAGIFTSHLGFESALSYDCATLTRSMLADNSPYYETGAKITFEATSKLTLTGLVLNGWQNIIDHNSNKALGTQIQFKPRKDVVYNWGTFYGKEAGAYENTAVVENTDSLSTMRFFNNFYLQAYIIKKIYMTAGFDIGIQKKRAGSGHYTWYSPVLILKYEITDKTAFAIRGEYYSDKNGVIVYSATPNGFQTFATSLNFDYKLADDIFWRIEGKFLHSKDKVYIDKDKPSNNNTLITSSLVIKF